jgi:hypothetical protein
MALSNPDLIEIEIQNHFKGCFARLQVFHDSVSPGPLSISMELFFFRKLAKLFVTMSY